MLPQSRQVNGAGSPRCPGPPLPSWPRDPGASREGGGSTEVVGGAKASGEQAASPGLGEKRGHPRAGGWWPSLCAGLRRGAPPALSCDPCAILSVRVPSFICCAPCWLRPSVLSTFHLPSIPPLQPPLPLSPPSPFPGPRKRGIRRRRRGSQELGALPPRGSASQACGLAAVGTRLNGVSLCSC